MTEAITRIIRDSVPEPYATRCIEGLRDHFHSCRGYTTETQTITEPFNPDPEPANPDPADSHNS
jgi:hypothetical protein